MKQTTKQIAEASFDYSRSLGTEDDSVYFEAALGKDGWYVSTIVDCNTSHFADFLITDDGPHATEGEALAAGLQHAVDWLMNNDIHRGWKGERIKLSREFRRMTEAERARGPVKAAQEAPSVAVGPAKGIVEGVPEAQRPRPTTEEAVADLEARISAEVAYAKQRIARKRRKEA